MNSVIVSAPGKVHLMGEHAVVYGKPALLSAINKRLIVTLEEIKAMNSRPGLEGRKLQITTIPQQSDSYIRYAVEVVCASLMKEIPSIHLTVNSDIPSGYHLGSSAAVAVATVGAMYYFFTNNWDLGKINDLAYEAEKKMHGNPSGGDNTTVTYGGFLWYRKKAETEKTFKKLSFVLPKRLDHFYLINTGRPKENTGELVKGVNDRFKLHTSTYNQLFDTNELQVKRIVDALQDGDEITLIDAMQKGEQTLEGMGVVSDKVKPLIRDIEKTDGAAKILGGGGVTDSVGFVLCYYTDRKAVEHIVSKFHYSIQPITLGEEGVRIEHK
jgi:mevalonate kinase